MGGGGRLRGQKPFFSFDLCSFVTSFLFFSFPKFSFFNFNAGFPPLKRSNMAASSITEPDRKLAFFPLILD